MEEIIFRKTTVMDLDAVMDIISQAQAYLKALNIDQWQNNYPSKKVIVNDIENNNSYVLTYNSQVVAIVAIIFDKEPTYDNIYNGGWLSNKDYVTIHRIAVDNNYKKLGLGRIILEKTKDLALAKDVASIRIDTHQDNLVMQKFILANNFSPCGYIYLSDKSKRLAYEKLIK